MVETSGSGKWHNCETAARVETDGTDIEGLC